MPDPLFSTCPARAWMRYGNLFLAVLKERRVDLAVLGTHGRSGFERLMLGSVAAGVLQKAECNLLVVPPVLESEEHRPGADWTYISDETPVLSGLS